MLRARAPLYAKVADIRIDTSSAKHDEVADVILSESRRVRHDTKMISSDIDNVGSAISKAKLKTQLVEFARELGFDSCRVPACAPPTHAEGIP